jgi:hypothetical protein
VKDAGFIFASYVVTFGSIGLFTAAVVRRARRLARQIPPEERPWT